jgi:hypothetical protein
VFAGVAGFLFGYFKVSGMTPRSSKACLWVLVGSASTGTVTLAPAKRAWLRVR